MEKEIHRAIGLLEDWHNNSKNRGGNIRVRVSVDYKTISFKIEDERAE